MLVAAPAAPLHSAPTQVQVPSVAPAVTLCAASTPVQVPAGAPAAPGFASGPARPFRAPGSHAVPSNPRSVTAAAPHHMAGVASAAQPAAPAGPPPPVATAHHAFVGRQLTDFYPGWSAGVNQGTGTADLFVALLTGRAIAPQGAARSRVAGTVFVSR